MPAQIRQALAHLIQEPAALWHLQIAPVRLAWVFEHLRIYVRLRPDQACLALFLENRPDLPLAQLEAVLEEFAALSATPQG